MRNHFPLSVRTGRNIQQQWQCILLFTLLTSGHHYTGSGGHASAASLGLQRRLSEKDQAVSIASGSSEAPISGTATSLHPPDLANPSATGDQDKPSTIQERQTSLVQAKPVIGSVAAMLMGSRTLKLPFTSLNQPLTPEQYILDVKFYIHEDSAVFDHFTYEKLGPCLRSRMSGDDAWKHETSEKAQYTAEIFILEQLRIHPKRTRDPEQATLFYIPVLSVLSFWAKECETFPNRTTTHENRMNMVYQYLYNNIHYQRFGGADHVMTASFWQAGLTTEPVRQLMFTRGMLAINERPVFVNWARWRCPEKVITIPYVGHSGIAMQKQQWGKKKFDFFFAGGDGAKLEHRSLLALLNVSRTSRIRVSNYSTVVVNSITEAQTRASTQLYTTQILTARFCLCPPEESHTSRRLYDAIAAGCIPVLTKSSLDLNMWPFSWRVRYEDFSLVVPDGIFGDPMELQEWGRALQAEMKVDQAKFILLNQNLFQARPLLLYNGPDPFVAAGYSLIGDSLLTQAHDIFRTSTFGCCEDESEFPSCKAGYEAQGQSEHACGANFKVKNNIFQAIQGAVAQPQDLAWPDVMQHQESKTFVCAIPQAGGKAVRKLLDTALGATDVPGSFRPQAQPYEIAEMLLNPDWVKVAIVRDPVTRVLAAYLATTKATEKESKLQLSSPTREGFMAFMTTLKTMYAAEPALNGYSTPPGLRPHISFCGLWDSAVLYDDVTRWEDLNTTLPRVLSSAGALWGGHIAGRAALITAAQTMKVGEAGAGGKRYHLMEDRTQLEAQRVTKYYTTSLLELVKTMYHDDFRRFGYNIEKWRPFVTS